MKNRNALSLAVAAAVIVAVSFGPSAFADSRHRGGTPSFRSFGHSFSHSFGRSVAPRIGRVAPRIGRVAPSYGRRFNDGRRFHGQGRIERISPYRGGYHVWLGGWGYPFFVPYRFWSPFRYRLGLFIGFNAFYDPLGYYSVFDAPSYDPYYDPPVYRHRAEDDMDVVRGTVQSVDLNTGVVTISDDVTRRTVAALLPPRDNRVDSIRVGDYIALSGYWSRGRDYEFDADRMDRFDPRR